MANHIDLASTLFKGCPEHLFAAKENVEYGNYVGDSYYSTTCGMDRKFNVLLPAGYSENKKYPVMYLLHGIFCDENSFINDPDLHMKELVGNMIAEGLLEDIIVIFPNMYATTDLSMQPAFNDDAVAPYDNFINDLYNDLMPYVEGHYSVLTGRENTILTGFSLGGRETIYISHMHPEKFGYVCAIAPAPGIVATKDQFMSHKGMLKEEEVKFTPGGIMPKVYIICCGTEDKVVCEYPESYHKIFGKNKTPHMWYTVQGADHNAAAISSGLYNILFMFTKTHKM